MIKSPLITICIPTYNREKFLPETLDSIIEQDGFNIDDIEIVISDNASVGNTATIVQEYQKKYKNIKYFRNDENIGSDRNILKVMQL
jgi:glycosyltransferase involved in cell wall biosynthesis